MVQIEIPGFRVSPSDWQRDAEAIGRVRRRVFVEEQGVPEAMEWEDGDGACAWFVARDRLGEVVGVARLTPEGRVGRMAVLPAWRRRGVGSALLRAALAMAAQRGFRQVSAHAQCQALPFYVRHGFEPEGVEFEEAGIPHRRVVFRFQGVIE
jgi:predicted GNAT family N-acyltransferase